MWTVRLPGACLRGAEAEIVGVEAWFEPARESTSPARTDVSLSGLPDAVVRDARTRVLSALTRTRLGPGPGQLHLNLVPAGRRKRGELLDLPLAMAVAAAAGHVHRELASEVLLLGELGIDGRLHDLPGALAAAEAAREHGVRRVVAPPRMAAEAAHLPGVQAFAARSLEDVVALLHDTGARPVGPSATTPPARDLATLASIRGQALGLEAAAVAAAGGHGLLLIGPPGTGKSLLARGLIGLLPAPTFEERLEITRIASAVGRWPGGLVNARPFRAPHHTTSFAGLVGGGTPVSAGEITLAHRGLLFLDELPEFRRDVLETLRQPLESGEVTISRASTRQVLPARFQLVAAMNPCPCGFAGHPTRTCHDTPFAVRRYRERISGPLLDRIDLRVELGPPPLAALTEPDVHGAAPGAEGRAGVDRLAERVDTARTFAQARQGARPNAELQGDELDRWSALDGEARSLLAAEDERHGLSPRAVQSLRRVARTLADLETCDTVGAEHLAAALELRRPV